MIREGPGNDNFPKVVNMRGEPLNASGVAEMRAKRRQLAIDGIWAQKIQSENQNSYGEGPYAARQAFFDFRGNEELHTEAKQIAPALERLKAIELAVLIQSLNINGDLNSDPAFSLALAEAYFQAITVLIKATLAMAEASGKKGWQALLPKYRRYDQTQTLELALMYEAESPENNMDRVTAIAAVLKERDDKNR